MAMDTKLEMDTKKALIKVTISYTPLFNYCKYHFDILQFLPSQFDTVIKEIRTEQSEIIFFKIEIKCEANEFEIWKKHFELLTDTHHNVITSNTLLIDLNCMLIVCLGTERHEKRTFVHAQLDRRVPSQNPWCRNPETPLQKHRMSRKTVHAKL